MADQWELCLQQESAGFSQTNSHSLITIIRVGFTTEQEVLTSLIHHQGPRLSETSSRLSPFRAVLGTRQRHFILILRGDKNAPDGVIDHRILTKVIRKGKYNASLVSSWCFIWQSIFFLSLGLCSLWARFLLFSFPIFFILSEFQSIRWWTKWPSQGLPGHFLLGRAVPKKTIADSLRKTSDNHQRSQRCPSPFSGGSDSHPFPCLDKGARNLHLVWAKTGLETDPVFWMFLLVSGMEFPGP